MLVTVIKELRALRGWYAYSLVVILGFAHQAKAQNLWLGAQTGLNIPVSFGVKSGNYFKAGTYTYEFLLDINAHLHLKNGLIFSGGYVRSYYPLGLKPNFHNWPERALYFNPGEIVVNDVRLGLGYNIGITNRLRFAPEIAFNCLLDRHRGGAFQTLAFSDGSKIAFKSYIFKPWFVPSISTAANFEVRFRNGMLFRLSCRFEAAFRRVARTVISVVDANSNPIEIYDYFTVPVMIQPTFGFHYPISRIWRGKPW